MKKLGIFLICVLSVSLLFYVSDAYAKDRMDLVIELLLKGNEKEAMQKYLYFDGTTIWILLCCFGLSFGMISLSSSVAKHFVGAGGGSGEAGSMAYATVTKTAGAALGLAGTAGRFGKRWFHEKSKNNELEQTRSAGNKTYEPPQQPTNGKDGEAGAAGKDGADGAAGEAGAKGAAGERGMAGDTGDAGREGDAGKDGENAAPAPVQPSSPAPASTPAQPSAPDGGSSQPASSPDTGSTGS